MVVGSNSSSDVLVVVDAPTPSQVAALVAPLRRMDRDRVAILTTSGTLARLPEFADRSSVPVVGDEIDRLLPATRCVLAVGDYLPLGAIARSHASRVDASFLVVQHGILAPIAPPLPRDCELAAWSPDDAMFWTTGRSDVRTTTVGSQLLWEAAQRRDDDRVPAGTADDPSMVFLGQLHGRELPRSSMARAAGSFCRSTGASYRPHPSEADLLSRLQHEVWRRRGIPIDRSTDAPGDHGETVVGMFSTGILEAAAAGAPAWSFFPDPPPWLEELWARYRIATFGSSSPTTVDVPTTEPAHAIASLVLERADGGRT